MATSLSSPTTPPPPRTRRTKSEFPIKVYAMLELADRIPEFGQAVTWLPHGRAFKIHDQNKFMNDVVPVFFNQTKIRSFNRQLHLWGFCRADDRIGRGQKKIWYHGNFLRGKPEDINLMIRTKIKGNMAGREGVIVPNFDDMPPLPVCSKLPSTIRSAMKNAIEELSSASLSWAVGDCVSTMPVPSQQQQQQQLGNVASGNHNEMALPRNDSAREVNVDLNQGETSFWVPPPFIRSVSNGSGSESQAMMNPCIPAMAMHYHSPQLVGSIGSTQPLTMHETNAQGFHHHPHMLDGNLHHDFFSSLRNEDFEPLPVTFAEDNAPHDDFASFIEGAIHQVGEQEPLQAALGIEVSKIDFQGMEVLM